jgi:hypothetical protein
MVSDGLRKTAAQKTVNRYRGLKNPTTRIVIENRNG